MARRSNLWQGSPALLTFVAHTASIHPDGSNDHDHGHVAAMVRIHQAKPAGGRLFILVNFLFAVGRADRTGAGIIDE